MRDSNYPIVASAATALYPLIPKAVVIDDLWFIQDGGHYYVAQVLVPPYLFKHYNLEKATRWLKYVNVPIFQHDQDTVRVSIKVGRKIVGIYFSPKEFIEKKPIAAAHALDEIQTLPNYYSLPDRLVVDDVGRYLLENSGMKLKGDKPLLVIDSVLGVINCIYGEKYAVVKIRDLVITGKHLHEFLIDPLVTLEKSEGSPLEKLALGTKLYEALLKMNKVQVFNVFVGLYLALDQIMTMPRAHKFLAGLEVTSGSDRFYVSNKFYYEVNLPGHIIQYRPLVKKYIGEKDLIIKKEKSND